MGLFKTKHSMVDTARTDQVASAWPKDTFDEMDEIDDTAFAEAIAAARLADADHDVTVAA